MPGKSHEQMSLAGYSPWGRERVGLDLATKQQQDVSSTFHNPGHVLGAPQLEILSRQEYKLTGQH